MYCLAHNLWTGGVFQGQLDQSESSPRMSCMKFNNMSHWRQSRKWKEGLPEGWKCWDNITRPDKNQSWESRNSKFVTIVDSFLISILTYSIQIHGLFACVCFMVSERIWWCWSILRTVHYAILAQEEKSNPIQDILYAQNMPKNFRWDSFNDEHFHWVCNRYHLGRNK